MSDVLGYSLTAVPFLLAFVLAVLVCLLWWTAYSNPAVGVGVLAFGYVVNTAIGFGGLQIGFNITVPDLTSVTVGVVTCIRLVGGHMNIRNRIGGAWFLLGVIWFGLFFVGLATYRSLAGVDFRNSFYLWIAVGYLLTFQLTADQLRACVNTLLLAGFAMLGLVFFRWVELMMGLPGLDWVEPNKEIRVVPSSAAQMLALCIGAGMAGWAGLSQRRMSWMVLAMMALPFVVLLQHRTVWLSTLAMLGAAFWLASLARKGRLGGILIPVIVGATVVGALALGPRSDVGADLGSSVSEATAQKSTLTWRVDSWREILSNWVRAGPKAWPAGQPFGTPLDRYNITQGSEVTVSAHSHYVTMLIRGGVVGFAAYLLIQLVTLRRLALGNAGEGEDPDAVSDPMLAMFVVCCMVYAGAYGVDYMQGLFLGLAYSRAVQKGPVRRTEPVRARFHAVHANRLRADVP